MVIFSGLKRRDNPNPHHTLIEDSPNDAVSQLSWCPTQHLLAASSWNGEVRVWEVQNRGHDVKSVGKLMYKHQAPVLCVEFTADGKVLSGGCDNVAKVHAFPGVNLGVGNVNCVDFGRHDAPIKTVHAMTELNAYVTGGWDRKFHFWDSRLSNKNPVFSNVLPETIYSSDYKKNLLVFACSSKKVYTFDARKPQQPLCVEDSKLRCQSRTIALFPDLSGYSLGSIEGRVSMSRYNDVNNSFAFKCHRDGNNTYAVNSISFNPKYGTFATCGSDGTYHFWDRIAKSRLHAFSQCSKPITASAFSGDGDLFALALGYDFSQGPKNDDYESKIFIQYCTPDKIAPKKSRSHSVAPSVVSSSLSTYSLD